MNIKRTITRTAAATLTAGLLIAGAAQAAAVDNREIGHAAAETNDAVFVQGIASGVMNAEVGHFALQVGTIDTGKAHDIYGDTKASLR